MSRRQDYRHSVVKFRAQLVWLSRDDREAAHPFTFRRGHCKTSPPIGIGGQPMPGSITESWRTGSAASQPRTGSRIPSGNCSILPGAMMQEPFAATAVGADASDDRRDARLDVVGNRGAF